MVGYLLNVFALRCNRAEPTDAVDVPPLLQNCSQPVDIGTTSRDSLALILTNLNEWKVIVFMIQGLLVEDANSTEFLRINIGGQRFLLKKETIFARKVGRLVWLLDLRTTSERLSLADAYFSSTNEYYFERPPALFNIIYQFYLTGQIHQPSHLCPNDILSELDYWGISPDNHLAPCCSSDEMHDLDSLSSSSSEESVNLFKHVRFGALRKRVWYIIEEPSRVDLLREQICLLLIQETPLGENASETGAFLVVRVLRVLRVIRVLKLGRYSSGLQMFGKTLQSSFRQLGMMAMVVFTGVIFFSTLVYFLEKDEPGAHVVQWLEDLRRTQGRDGSISRLWLTKSPILRRYGDLTPITIAGKLVATGAIACGVLVLALPITIIVDNFMRVAEGERIPVRRTERRFGQRPPEQLPSELVTTNNNLVRTMSMKKSNTDSTVC
ncbi:hypothetical protein KIN20_038295 [Parelaphostrongylus tenuis]|uniref:BTB domain-containing protein n=1 Tax=Parelaphostrongylus tenuis TaxID=148309 RepID=A0AAD5WLH4_PARTN|nr:hypothetical protein KIN20_038295 [Parelaphostrongylus tenuis]